MTEEKRRVEEFGADDENFINKIISDIEKEGLGSVMKSSLHRSILSHLRLKNKYSKSTSDYDRFVKSNYHSECVDRQIKYGRRLTSSEKKSLYKTTEYYFFN